jgi:hypothetical protein
VSDEHIVHVAANAIPGRNALYAAECSECGWRSREYRDFERACQAADKHADSTQQQPPEQPEEES